MLGIELIRDALEVFEDKLERDLLELEEANQRGDTSEFVRIAHRLKGACASIGFKSLGLVFAKLETDPSAELELVSIRALATSSGAALRHLVGGH